MHITITEQEYQELMRIKRAYEHLVKMEESLNDFIKRMQSKKTTFNLTEEQKEDYRDLYNQIMLRNY